MYRERQVPYLTRPVHPLQIAKRSDDEMMLAFPEDGNKGLLKAVRGEKHFALHDARSKSWSKSDCLPESVPSRSAVAALLLPADPGSMQAESSHLG